MTYSCLGNLRIGSMLDALVCSGDLSGASGVQDGIGSVGANQNAQMAWLLFINVQHRQLTTRYELSFAKRSSSISR